MNTTEMLERGSLKEGCAELSLLSADLNAHIDICSLRADVPLLGGTITLRCSSGRTEHGVIPALPQDRSGISQPQLCSSC